MPKMRDFMPLRSFGLLIMVWFGGMADFMVIQCICVAPVLAFAAEPR